MPMFNYEHFRKYCLSIQVYDFEIKAKFETLSHIIISYIIDNWHVCVNDKNIYIYANVMSNRILIRFENDL